MPAVTYLSDAEIRAWQSIPDDSEADEILQELRKQTGGNWLVQVHPMQWNRGMFRKPGTGKLYTLYADCHGEWQVMNLCTKGGGSIFNGSVEDSRQDVMNFMLGMIAGWHERSKALSGDKQ